HARAHPLRLPVPLSPPPLPPPPPFPLSLHQYPNSPQYAEEKSFGPRQDHQRSYDHSNLEAPSMMQPQRDNVDQREDRLGHIVGAKKEEGRLQPDERNGQRR